MESTNQSAQRAKTQPAKRRQLGLLSATAVVAALGGAAIAGGAVSAATGGAAEDTPATTIRLAQSVETTVPNPGDPVVMTFPDSEDAETPLATQPGDDDTHDECDFGDFDDFDLEFGEALPQEMIDEINAESLQLAKFLDGKGISYVTETDDLGLSFPAPADDDEAGWAAVDEFFEAKYGDFDDFDDFDFDEDLPQEMINEINAEGTELAKFLDEKGVSYTVETDDLGISFPEPTDDDEAGWAAVEEFFQEKYGDSDSDFDEVGDLEPDTATP